MGIPRSSLCCRSHFIWATVGLMLIGFPFILAAVAWSLWRHCSARGSDLLRLAGPLKPPPVTPMPLTRLGLFVNSLMRRHGSNPPGPGSKPEPPYGPPNQSIEQTKPQPHGGRLFINGIEQPRQPTGHILPSGLRRGPDCRIRICNGRPSIVTHRNPYTLSVLVTAAVVVGTMAFDTPTLARALAVILCAICIVLFLADLR